MTRMLDGNEAGKSAATGIADWLHRSIFQVGFVELPEEVQPDQMSNHNLRQLLNSCV